MSRINEKQRSEKILKIVLVSFLVVMLILIAFFASTSKKNEKSVIKDNGKEYLQKATSDASEINEEERTKLNEITADSFIDLYNSSDYSVVLITRETCDYCKIATPIIENLLYKYKFSINSIDIEKLTDEERKQIADTNSYFSEGFSTPTLLLIGNNEIKDKLEGLGTKSEYKSFFKAYGYIK